MSHPKRLGKWNLVKTLGPRGGNGQVFLVRDDEQLFAAMKVLHKQNPTAYQRFRDEIETMEKCADLDGVLPVLDKYLPDQPSEEDPTWFVMPRATPIEQALGVAFAELVDAMIQVADTLVQLHVRGITHRDVKPANLLYWKDRYVVGDLGLVDFPEKKDITPDKDEVGAKRTISPEMKRWPKPDDTRPSDVYSLAKTLWILATGKKAGFDGQYNPTTNGIGLKSFHVRLPLRHQIDKLLIASTSNDPADRPTMLGFRDSLAKWRAEQGQFPAVSLGDWSELQEQLFPLVIPERAEWHDLGSIVVVLQLLAENARLNHTFAPDGGGLDLRSAEESNEEGCLGLKFSPGSHVVFRPKRLVFESFPGFPTWSYFRLENAGLDATDTYKEVHGIREDLVEIVPGQYIDMGHWDYGCYPDPATDEDRPLPSSARIVARYLSGDFVVFAKASTYNQIDDYRGRHNKVSTDQFRDQIAQLLRRIR